MSKNGVVLQATAIKQLIANSENSAFWLIGKLNKGFIIEVRIDDNTYIVSNVSQNVPKTYKQIDRAVAYIVEEFCVDTIKLELEVK